MDNRTKNYVEVDGNVLPGSLRGVIELFDEIVETIKGLKPGERKVVYFELVYVSIRTGSSDMFARVFSGSLTSAAKR